MHKLTAVIVSAATALALSACEVPEDPKSSDSGSSSESGSTSAKTNYTAAQVQAIAAVKSYLQVGTGFSRQGLIQQLSSKAGNGFKRKDAVFAVNHTKINYNQQAALAAKNYLDLGTGFSRDSLIQQLTSKAGNGFTQQQAVFAAKKVGLG